MMSILTLKESQMDDWRAICAKVAEKLKAELLFVNDTSCGLQLSDGQFSHIYVDEMAELVKSLA